MQKLKDLYINTVLLWYFSYFVLYALSYSAVYINQHLLGVISWYGYDAYLPNKAMSIIGYALTFANTAIFIGLLYYKSWARSAFSGFLALSVVVVLALGIAVYTPLEKLLLMVHCITAGVVTTLLYVSPIKKCFNKTSGE